MGSAPLLALLACTNISNGEMQRLWQMVGEQARQVAGLVPGRVETFTEVRAGNGKLVGTVRELWTLKGWREGKPDYEVQREETGKPDITLTLCLSGKFTPFFEASEGKLQLRKVISEVGEGRCLIRYEFEMTEVEKDGKPMTLEGMAWLDGATGGPVKVMYRRKDLATPIKKWELTLLFPSQTGAPPLPMEATLHMEVGTLLWKRSVVVSQQLEEWRPPR